MPFHVTPLAYRGSTIFSPVSPEKVDQNTKLTLVAGSYFGGLDLSGGSGGYTVTALVPQTADDDPDGITENQLRAASTTYPAEITNLYLDVPPGSVGPDMRALLTTVESLTPNDDPYDLAQTAVSYMRSPNAFTYSTDVTDLNCGDRSIAECFAHFKRGYCQYYATTMTMLMRMAGIPARYVQGFLPGQRDANGVETILYSSSHAWVEVYFPGYGWITFDPTGGGVGRLTSLPAGPPVPSEKPTAAPSRIVGDDERDPLQALPPGGDIVPQSSGGIVTPGGPLVIVVPAPVHRDRLGRAGCVASKSRAADAARGRVQRGHATRRPARIQAAAHRDGVRVHGRARRGAAEGSAGPADRGQCQGRGGVRARRSAAGSAGGAA